MKKTYIIPLAEVVKTETEEMICQSIIISGEEFNGDDMTILDNDTFENVFEDLW